MKKKQVMSLVVAGALVASSFPLVSFGARAVQAEGLQMIPRSQMEATANTEQKPAAGNDGPADFAIDGAVGQPNYDTLWHARYSGNPPVGQAPNATMPQTLTLKLNKNEGQKAYPVKGIEITGRSSNYVTKYKLQIANVADGATPKEGDFKTVSMGTLGKGQELSNFSGGF